jgi:hypothetical protein
MASVTHGMIGNSGESSSVTFYLPDVTGANYDDVTGNGVGQNVGDLRLAVAAVTLMNFTKHTVTTEQYAEAGTLPADANAQREIKLWVQYVDTVNARVGSLSIPGPNLSILAQTGTDVVDHTSNAAAIALTNAIEANAVSRDGNPIAVRLMKIVGRNN